MSLLSKKYFEAPIIDLALLILASISESSLRRGVIRLPRYLNLFVKCTFFPLGSRMSLGRWLLARSSLACLSEGGKYMASDLDLMESDPRCIISPKRAKCSLSWMMVS